MGVLFLNYNTKRESRSECKLYNAWRVRRPLYTCNTHHHTVVRSDNMRRERFNFLTSTRFTPTTRQAISIYFFHPKLLDDISAPSQIDQTADLLDSHNGRSFTREGLSTKETLPQHPLFSVRFVPPGTNTQKRT